MRAGRGHGRHVGPVLRTGVVRLVAIVAVSICARQGGTLDAQATQGPPAEGDTAAITGRILSEAGAPIGSATVSATSGSRSFRTLSDRTGTFALERLPAGTYSLTARKPGLIPWAFGQRRIGEAGQPIVVASRQVVANLSIRLARGGAIAGTLVDESGVPLTGAVVRAQKVRYIRGQQELVDVGTSDTTDDLGAFRVYGLEPGDYFVLASPERVQFADLGPAAKGNGPTYFPGSPKVDEAVPIALGPGEARLDAVFAMTSAPLARVSGTVVDLSGQPLVGASVNLNHRSGGRVSAVGGGVLRPDGSFTFSAVPPGAYRIRAIALGNGKLPTIAELAIDVDGNALDGLRLDTREWAIGRGRVVFRGETSLPGQATPVRVGGRPREPDSTVSGAGDAALEAGLLFEFKTLPGRMMVGPTTPLPEGFYLRAVRLNGEDVTDRGIDFAPGGEVGPIEVELTRATQRIAGSVGDSSGTGDGNGTVIVFPVDRERRWWGSRHIAAARTPASGVFAFEGVPPGSYYVVALDYVETDRWLVPAFLESLEKLASRVDIGEDDTKDLYLNVRRLR